MTPEELRAKYPEVVAQIEAAAREAASAEATAAERSRLKEIEAIEKTVGDAELIAAAKYGDNACTAQELAFNAMKKQAQLGEQHIQNAAADFRASKLPASDRFLTPGHLLRKIRHRTKTLRSRNSPL